MKKVLSIVLSIAMVVCLMPSMAFASADASGTGEVDGRQTFTDIDGMKCEGAVNVLNALGVVNGFPDGTFRPGEDVTRAHMAQMITKALDVETYANATTSIFSDMDSATWAIPQVEYCAQLGIVKGYGDGTFGPNDLVTYEQAATMLTRAIGYTDDCNEMIAGVWPANYVQKALDLGIFSDTNNGGQKNANRGDVALMMYNALNLPQVYIDNDGATRYRNGSEEFTRGGENFYGTSMLYTLNKDGKYQYKVVDMDDVDNAIYGIQEYLGAVAKVYENKDGDVLAIGDIQTTFITGTFNGDFDEFTTADKVYTFSDNAVKHVTSDPNESFDKGDGDAMLFVNGSNYPTWTFDELGKNSDLINLVPNYGVKQNQKVTLAVRVNGSSVSQVYSAVLWYIRPGDVGSLAKVIEDSDISAISTNHKLFGQEFKTDADGDNDVNTFTLEGVDSLEDIAEDDVVAVYNYNNGKIRRVEVGTEKVEGNLDSFSTGSLGSSEAKNNQKDRGKSATAVIDGTSYKTSVLTIPFAGDGENTDDYPNLDDWTDDDSDSADVGDLIKVYLDVNGNIFRSETSEAGSSSYALILDYDVRGYSTNNKDEVVVSNDAGLNGSASMVELMTANGSIYTFYFKNDAVVATDSKEIVNAEDGEEGLEYIRYLEDPTHVLRVGDIVTYQLNSSNRIRKINLKAPSAIDDREIKELAQEYCGDGKIDDVSSKGYWKGTAIAENVTAFSIDKFKDRSDTWDEDVDTNIPNTYIDDDNVGVVSFESLKGTDDVGAYAALRKSNKYTAMALNGDAVSSTKTFGFITSWTKLGSDHSSGCDYQVTALIDGTSSTYYYDVSDSSYEDPKFEEKQQLLQIKFNANGYINRIYTYENDYIPYDDDNNTLGNFEGRLLGYNKSSELMTGSDGKDYNDSGVTIRSNSVAVYRNDQDAAWNVGQVYTLDSDVIYYEWKGGPGNVALSTKADITGADDGKYVLYYDVATDDVDHPDGIIDIVILANEEVLMANGWEENNADAYFVSIIESLEDNEEEASIAVA